MQCQYICPEKGKLNLTVKIFQNETNDYDKQCSTVCIATRYPADLQLDNNNLLINMQIGKKLFDSDNCLKSFIKQKFY